MRKLMVRLASAAVIVLAAVCLTACQTNNGSNPQANGQSISPTTNPSQAGYEQRHAVGNGAFGEDVP